MFRVAFDQRDVGVRPARFAQIGQRLLVNRKEAHGRAVVGGHIGNQGPIGHFHRRQGRPEELDELIDHAFGAKYFRDGQHQVRGRDAGPQPARELEADHVGRKDANRLAEHHPFGLDAADAPAEHAQAVDHRRVAVGAHDRVGHRHRTAFVLAQADAFRQIFEIHLMDDAGAGRHDAEIAKRLLPPTQEFVPLAVALELDVDVFAQRGGRTEAVDLHRMVDDQVGLDQRIDPLWIAAEAVHRAAHGG